MQIYGPADDCPLSEFRPAVTIGVFDGVHRGHKTIIETLKQTAKPLGVPSMAVTFATHPRQALGRAAPLSICSLEKRLWLMAQAGLDAAWVLPFTLDFSLMSGKHFAEEYFLRRLNASAVVLGESASFGHNREGNAVTLAQWGKEWGFPVVAVPPVAVNDSVVSSTAIRLAVQSGDLGRAELFLGRKFSVEGTVVHGQGNGKHLGFPTLNLDPHHELRPPAGVYLTRTLIDAVLRDSVTNIGRPPTEMEIEAGMTDFLIETHLLDFDGDLYGKTAEVFFYEKLRDVQRFPRTSGLMRKVGGDVLKARAWFADNPEK